MNSFNECCMNGLGGIPMFDWVLLITPFNNTDIVACNWMPQSIILTNLKKICAHKARVGIYHVKTWCKSNLQAKLTKLVKVHRSSCLTNLDWWLVIILVWSAVAGQTDPIQHVPGAPNSMVWYYRGDLGREDRVGVIFTSTISELREMGHFNKNKSNQPF